MMEAIMMALAGSTRTLVVWNLLAASTAALLLLCVLGLRCRPLRRCRLGCLLILRWICLADLGYVAHRIVFFLLDYTVASAQSRLLLTWTCKLFRVFETLLMLMQAWLLSLLAMERVLVKMRPRLGLRHFSRLRLRVGIAIAGVLAFSIHINYIYLFAPRLEPIEVFTAEEAAAAFGNGSGLNGSSRFAYRETCSVDVGFQAFLKYAKLAEVLLGVYLPVLVINCCAVLLCLHCAARGATDLRCHAARLLPSSTPPKMSSSGAAATSTDRIVAFVNRCNSTVSLMFLLLGLVCYLPMEITGIYNALNVHGGVANSNMYIFLNNLFLPTKCMLDALVIGPLLLYLLSMARRLCPATLGRATDRDVSISASNGANSRGGRAGEAVDVEDEAAEAGRAAGNSDGDGVHRPGREPIELEVLDPNGHRP